MPRKLRGLCKSHRTLPVAAERGRIGRQVEARPVGPFLFLEQQTFSRPFLSGSGLCPTPLTLPRAPPLTGLDTPQCGLGSRRPESSSWSPPPRADAHFRAHHGRTREALTQRLCRVHLRPPLLEIHCWPQVQSQREPESVMQQLRWWPVAMATRTVDGQGRGFDSCCQMFALSFLDINMLFGF